MTKDLTVPRYESRVPMTFAVNISSFRQPPGVETTFTENVSTRGARVSSTRLWHPGERLCFALLPGDFRVTARVVYCHPLRSREFALGLEFLEPAARWFSSSSIGSGEN